MDTIKYVFVKRQPELQKLVVKYGMKPAVNQHDLWLKVNALVKKHREVFMKDLADIHPDKDLIKWSLSLDKKDSPELIEENKPSESVLAKIQNGISVEPQKTSNACGCSGADGEKTSGCCGSSSVSGEKTSACSGCDSMKSNFSGADITEKIKNNLPLVVVGSLALVLGVMLIAKNK